MRRIYWRRLVCLTLAWAASVTTGIAQTAPMSDIKAAFVYNFAKFTEWPADALPPAAPIALCVVDDVRLATALAKLVHGRRIDNRVLIVRGMREISNEVRTCHVLYAAELNAGSTGELLVEVGESAVLTISDYPRFAELGGVANFILEDGKLHFAVNIGAAQRVHLQLSSQLLTLGKLVKGSHARP